MAKKKRKGRTQNLQLVSIDFEWLGQLLTDRITNQLARQKALTEKASPPRDQQRVEAEGMGSSQRSLLEGIAKSFNCPDHADVMIHIGQYEMPAHSLVLATQSEYFKRALKGQFAESISKEFVFKEGSFHAYWRVFEYMYTGKYSIETSELLDAPDDDELMKHFRVYELADFFNISSLKDYAFDMFKDKLKSIEFTEGFISCVKHVYSSTNEYDKIRGLVADASREHLAELWIMPSFRELVREGGDFAVDIVARSVKSDL